MWSLALFSSDSKFSFIVVADSVKYRQIQAQIQAQAFQGCCVCLFLCSALEEGMHKTYLLRVLPSSSAYYTLKYLGWCRDIGPNRLIFPRQASPDRVFSHKEQRWWPEVYFHNVMHIELVIKSDTTRVGLIFADLNFEALFYPVSNQKMLVSERYYVPWQLMKTWQKFYS